MSGRWLCCQSKSGRFFAHYFATDREVSACRLVWRSSVVRAVPPRKCGACLRVMEYAEDPTSAAGAYLETP